MAESSFNSFLASKLYILLRFQNVLVVVIFSVLYFCYHLHYVHDMFCC